MSERDLAEELAERFLSPDQPELRQLVAEGLAPLPPEQLLPLQIELIGDSDESISTLAREALTSMEPRIAADVLEETESSKLVEFFATDVRNTTTSEAILKRRDVAYEVLEDLARIVPPDLQELLLLRQDAIVERPTILDALSDNEKVSTFSSRRIAEYRQHLIPRARAAKPKLERGEPLEEEEELELDVEAIQAQYDEAEKKNDEEWVERLVALTEAQIRALPVPQRLKLSRKAPRALRLVLIRDQSSTVALSVLRFNRLTDSEVEQVINSRTVLEDVLAAIGRDVQWIRKYSVVHALVRNPKTPRGLAMRLVTRLSVRHLRELGKDRNAAEAVRTQARRLYTIKMK